MGGEREQYSRCIQKHVHECTIVCSVHDRARQITADIFSVAVALMKSNTQNISSNLLYTVVNITLSTLVDEIQC